MTTFTNTTEQIEDAAGQQRCGYVARKSQPATWHGREPDEWALDCQPHAGGLGRTSWHCPHPALSSTVDTKPRCPFHTPPAQLPDSVDETAALLGAVAAAGDRPDPTRPEHYGQFIGAEFGSIDLSGMKLVATDADLRFDHARFDGAGSDLRFDNTTFATTGDAPLSFYRTQFLTEDAGTLSFRRASFEVHGRGDISFAKSQFVNRRVGGTMDWRGVDFSTAGPGSIRFADATFLADETSFDDCRFRTTDRGAVQFFGAAWETVGPLSFKDAAFISAGQGDVNFSETTMQTRSGELTFADTYFGAREYGDVSFREAVYLADTRRELSFANTTFDAQCAGDVRFDDASFTLQGRGQLRFDGASFEADSLGCISFEDAMFRTYGENVLQFAGAELSADAAGAVCFDEARFVVEGVGHVDFTGTRIDASDAALIGVRDARFCTDRWGDVIFDEICMDARDSARIDLGGSELEALGEGVVSVSGAQFETRAAGQIRRPKHTDRPPE